MGKHHVHQHERLNFHLAALGSSALLRGALRGSTSITADGTSSLLTSHKYTTFGGLHGFNFNYLRRHSQIQKQEYRLLEKVYFLLQFIITERKYK